MRLTLVTPLVHFGGGAHLDRAGDGRAMREGAAHCGPLNVAGDVQRIAHSDISRHRWSINPGAGLPDMPFSANILDQVVPDANHASVNVLG